ncbi:helix-turn-helix transcriptional regulator [Imhoffiella purpurea]|nr:AraC family transcriptional regulator [Imhoffiella purpurea]
MRDLETDSGRRASMMVEGGLDPESDVTGVRGCVTVLHPESSDDKNAPIDSDSYFFCDLAMYPDSEPEALVSPPSDPSVVSLQPGFLVCHTSARDLDAVDRVREFAGDCEFLHLNCQLDGRFEGFVGPYSLSYAKGDLSLGFSSGETFRVRHCARFRNLAVMLTPRVLESLAGEEAASVLGKTEAQDFFLRHAGVCRKAWQSASVVADLMATDPGHRLLFQSATLEFLHWHLAAFRGRAGTRSLSHRDCLRLEDARNLLLQDLASPPTIADLARALGMSQFKLKDGFKRRFGCGIYELFQRQRMQEARRLLQHHNVTETAVLLGYTNISHFSAAFRKQFGLLPSRVRGTGSSLGV